MVSPAARAPSARRDNFFPNAGNGDTLKSNVGEGRRCDPERSEGEAIQTKPPPQSSSLDCFALLAMTNPAASP